MFALERAFWTLPSSISHHAEPDSATEQRTSFSRDVVDGYKVTVSVPESYASEQYNKYAVKALPFRDKLLCNHKELIKEMLGFDKSFPVVGYHESEMKSFYVLPNGVSDCSEMYSDSRDCRFVDYGMCNLNGITECYGLALAIIEIFRPEWERHGKCDTRISVEGQSICVERFITREKPTLNSW